MVRGKGNAEMEFRAKISVSLVNGSLRLERLSWDNFHEAGTLPAAVEAYRERYGYYPEEVLVDQIFRSRENRRYCKERGIRLSGPPLGRPPKGDSTQNWADER